MNLKRILLTAILGIASMHQTAWSQTTDRWFVVRDATDLTYAFEFICLGDRTAAQDTAAGLRILDSDGSVHALPERAFKAQQTAGLIKSAFKEFLCAGEVGIDREVDKPGEQAEWSEDFNVHRADRTIKHPNFGSLKQETAAIPVQMVVSKRKASISRRSSRASINVSKPKYPLLVLLLASAAARGP